MSLGTTLDKGTTVGEKVIATPKSAVAAMPDNSHTSFLLLIGQVIAVIVLAWVAGIDDRIGTIIVAFFLVLWLIFLINRSDVIKSWGNKVGLG